jgi:linearmycin/streptolysin S transport system permease protein
MKAWVLARKDLRVYFRDRVAVLLGFGLPIALCTVFGAAMGAIGGGDSVGRIELALEDLDQSEASRALVAELGAAKGLRLDVLAAPADGGEPESARARVAEGDAPAGLRIGAGFGAALAQGDELPLTLYRDPGKTIEQQILAGNLIPAFLGALGDRLGPRLGGKILDSIDFPALGRERAQAILDGSWTSMEGLVAELRTEKASDDAGDGDGADDGKDDSADDDGFDFASAAAGILGLQVEDVVGGDQNRKAQKQAQQAQSVAGMAVMMLLFGLIHCGGTLLEEEHSGTLDRLRLAPGAANAVLGGKMIFTWCVGSMQLVVLFLYGNLVFDVPILRAPLALVALSAVTAAAVTGFGVLFAVVCRSKAQLEGLSTIVVLTMSALGGSWWPLAITPEWYQKLGHLTLNAWAMDGYQGIFWYEKDVLGILPEIGVLAGIALGTALLAWRLFERRLRV